MATPLGQTLQSTNFINKFETTVISEGEKILSEIENALSFKDVAIKKAENGFDSVKEDLKAVGTQIDGAIATAKKRIAALEAEISQLLGHVATLNTHQATIANVVNTVPATPIPDTTANTVLPQTNPVSNS